MPEHNVALALDTFTADPNVLRLHEILRQPPTFNFFEALGMVRHELSHSDMLAFLLNPYATHGLGLGFLQSLVAQTQPSLDLTRLRLDRIEVRREWENIDILVVSPSDRLVMLVENKIDSTEHSNQLERYHDIVTTRYQGWQCVALYLTPGGDPPIRLIDRDRYRAVSYREVLHIIEELLPSAKDDVDVILRHYCVVLRNHIVLDNEHDTGQIFRRVYRQHQQVIDHMIRYRDQRMKMISRAVDRLLLETETNYPGLLRRDDPWSQYETHTWFVRFAPVEWYRPELRIAERWTKSQMILLFQLRFSPNDILIDLAVGPEREPVGVRNTLFALAQERCGPLRSTWNDPSNDWFGIYGRVIIDSHTEYFSSWSDATIKQALRAGFEAFLREDVPQIRRSIQEAVPPGD